MPKKKTQPLAIVIQFPGSNGDRDLCEALSNVGFETTYHPSNQSIESKPDFIGLPGGFSYGDYWRAGMLASQAPAVQSIPKHAESGSLVLGICNGFQILVEAGILKGALSYNTPPKFRHQPVEVEVTSEATASPFFHNIAMGTKWTWPMANGEGRFIHAKNKQDSTHIALTYKNNPNGSAANAAAVLDASKRVLGVMPHPERAVDSALWATGTKATSGPSETHGAKREGSSDGLPLLQAAHTWICNRI